MTWFKKKGQKSAHLPVSEVWKFGIRILGRLALGVVVGLCAMKLGQALELFPREQSVLMGELVAGGVFFISFLIRPVPYPEFDYGDPPEPEAESDRPEG